MAAPLSLVPGETNALKERFGAQVLRVEETCDEVAEPGGGQVGVGPQRGRVRAERQLRDQAVKLPVQQPHDGIPQSRPHEIAVQEDNRRAGAGLPVMQRAVGQFGVGHCSS